MVEFRANVGGRGSWRARSSHAEQLFFGVAMAAHLLLNQRSQPSPSTIPKAMTRQGRRRRPSRQANHPQYHPCQFVIYVKIGDFGGDHAGF